MTTLTSLTYNMPIKIIKTGDTFGVYGEMLILEGNFPVL